MGANRDAPGMAITKTRHLLVGLESFKAYWFCVCAIGAAGEGAKSDVCLGRAACVGRSLERDSPGRKAGAVLCP